MSALKRPHLACFAGLALAGCLAWAAASPADPALNPLVAGPNAIAITSNYMRDVLFFLSSDTLAGRMTPSTGLDTAALYLASNLAQLGLEGGGDTPGEGDPKLGPLAPFLYHFALARSQISSARLSLDGRSFNLGTDFTITGVDADHHASGQLAFPGGETAAIMDGNDVLAIIHGGAQPRRPPSAYHVDRFLPPAGSVPPQVFAGADLWEALRKAQPGAVIDLTVSASTQHAQAEDVIAILPGSDPVLRHQYLVISAHLDHLGVGKPVNGDAIYNGADDDGSGSTALLALARAYATGPPPRRSIAFIWHAGEEEGLWGSEYFTRFPTIALPDIITDLNMDMIGRSKPAGDTNAADARLTSADEIYVIGPEVSSSDLEHTMDAVNAGDYRLQLNHYYDRTDDPEHIFYRSDHFNYAAQGIPIIFFFDGVHRDYHRPGDEPQKIDYHKMQEVARTVYAIGWRLANQAAVPKINAALPAPLVKAMTLARQQHTADAARFHPPPPRFH